MTVGGTPTRSRGKKNWGSEVGQTRDQVSRDHVVKTNWGSEVGQTRDQVFFDPIKPKKKKKKNTL
jgi:hypothetical protein